MSVKHQKDPQPRPYDRVIIEGDERVLRIAEVSNGTAKLRESRSEERRRRCRLGERPSIIIIVETDALELDRVAGLWRCGAEAITF